MSIDLCKADDLDDRTARGFDILGNGRDALFVIRINDTFHGYLNACPHYDPSARVPLAWSKDKYLNAGGTHIVCSGHGAFFEPETGLCIRGPCKGAVLTRMAIEISSDGMLKLPNTSLTGDDNDSNR
ncbi:Rieske (2Fe-2S) protein [Paraburkholderia strydomiana]|uniref:Rieske (2Fe-2S) protein n=1 Tax=Paraburkholderia strydomiana TaxID=1245417 RepID=UPI0038BD6AA4